MCTTSVLLTSCSKAKPNTLKNVDVATFSLDDHRMRVVTKERDRIARFSELQVEGREGFIVATNGGIFGRDVKPLGLLVDGGHVLSPLNTRDGEGNFYLKPNGVFYIQSGKARVVNSMEYKVTKPDFAIQSGPLLLLNGKVHPKFSANSKHQYTRNGIGVSKDGLVKIAYFGNPCTLYEMAVHFRDELGCESALYLDGAIYGLMTKDKVIRPQQVYASIVVVEKLK